MLPTDKNCVRHMGRRSNESSRFERHRNSVGWTCGRVEETAFNKPGSSRLPRSPRPARLRRAPAAPCAPAQRRADQSPQMNNPTTDDYVALAEISPVLLAQPSNSALWIRRRLRCSRNRLSPTWYHGIGSDKALSDNFASSCFSRAGSLPHDCIDDQRRRDSRHQDRQRGA